MKSLIKKAKGFTLVELMVVIVIVGILAAVAIPKFLDASNKAKASEFPTQLTAIYTGEMAYNAENGSYTGEFASLTSTAGVDIQTTSKWFSYLLTANGTGQASFHATAKVAVAFGGATTADTGGVDQANSKVCSDNLKRYCPNWRN